MTDKLRGVWTFREVYDYLYKTGQLPRDDFDFDYEMTYKILKELMPNLKENSITLVSTPNQKKRFFWEMYNKHTQR